MSKGFQGSNDEIWVESMVASRTLSPAIKIKWQGKEAMLSPEEARHHAHGILGAIAAAEIDACLMQWAVQKLEIQPQQAAQILQHFREKRATGTMPSITINFDGDHLRPDTAREYATWLNDAAFSAEIEAFLVVFLMQDLDQSAEIADQLVQEFREMRGAKTIWPTQEES